MIRAGRYAVGAYSELPEGTAFKVRAGGILLAVFKVRGEIQVIEDTCSHGQASLSEGEVSSEYCTVLCPLHGSIFDLETGEALSAPATSAVESFETEVEDDQIVVTII